MKDNLNIFDNGRQPQFLWMEDDLNFALGNIVSTQLDEIWKMI